jgi:hypothetical protein
MAGCEKKEMRGGDMNELEEINLKRSLSDLADDLQSVTSQTSGLEPTDLETISAIVRTAARKRQGQSLELLALLRLLEALHQEIRDSLFQSSLPDNRQALYALLRDIEADGGWPYIHRMKLQEFLANLAMQLDDEPSELG